MNSNIIYYYNMNDTTEYPVNKLFEKYIARLVNVLKI